ncbi:hypothetical protein [Paractinoplanes lichenicola]|uniref:ASCH domain-containing protein n=1 Tax=Paractinoplanes lichenicola TaxID=2802976 RepID=A0ABS1VHK5_9ACTN|nr:hypothetical protein [Actinoplanes lichenicola]MBL7254149.1 hypothetical protein [Actinoplanes lichenicola]
MSDLREFRRVCHEGARLTGGRVTEFRVSDRVTPNFHQGIVDYGDRTVAVVIARDTGAVAVAEPRSLDGDWGPLTFVDLPDLIGALAFAGEFRVLTPEELAAPLDPARWPELSAYDIRSWKPESTGAALFNFWD